MMKDLLWAESQKLHRSKILWIAGFATVMVGLIVFAQGQFTFYDRRYIDGAGWFMTAAQSLATFYVLPAVISPIGKLYDLPGGTGGYLKISAAHSRR